MQDVQEAYRLIEREMNDMEELARRSLDNVDSFVSEVVRYSFRFGGKRLRPALLFLAGKAVGTLTEQHTRTATAVELIHTASLIHDDILDGASIRRHLDTVNVRWNAQIGVLAGDVLLTRALEIMTQEDEMYGFRRLTDACRKTCEGELRQIGTIGRFEMTRDEYFDMIAGKTAPLLACSAELGARYAGADEATTECFRLFGHRLGLAFQVIDDILDLVGEADTAGKTLRTDLINRKPTLPLILYLRDADEADRRQTLQRLRQEDWVEADTDEIVARLRESGSVQRARGEAGRLIDDAIAAISDLPVDPDTVAALASIARFVGRRKK